VSRDKLCGYTVLRLFKQALRWKPLAGRQEAAVGLTSPIVYVILRTDPEVISDNEMASGFFLAMRIICYYG
jgi:hypothetical protein